MMKLETMTKIKVIAERIGHPDWTEGEKHYWIGSPNGGGIAGKYTLEDALDLAAEMTSDEYYDPESVLIVTNEMNYVICLFCDGEVYLKAERNISSKAQT